jgi:hypothetical protein
VKTLFVLMPLGCKNKRHSSLGRFNDRNHYITLRIEYFCKYLRIDNGNGIIATPKNPSIELIDYFSNRNVASTAMLVFARVCGTGMKLRLH